VTSLTAPTHTAHTHPPTLTTHSHAIPPARAAVSQVPRCMLLSALHLLIWKAEGNSRQSQLRHLQPQHTQHTHTHTHPTHMFYTHHASYKGSSQLDGAAGWGSRLVCTPSLSAAAEPHTPHTRGSQALSRQRVRCDITDSPHIQRTHTPPPPPPPHTHTTPHNTLTRHSTCQGSSQSGALLSAAAERPAPPDWEGESTAGRAS